jgi:serine/threonine protein kinase
MNEFRQALDAHAEGRLDLSGVERELHLGLTRQPHLAAAHGALVEAVYRSGRIDGQTYLALIQIVRSFQQKQPKVEVQVAPPSAEPSASQPADGAEKTRFRPPGGAAAASTGTPASDAPEKTQFRAPRPSTTASAPPGVQPPPPAAGGYWPGADPLVTPPPGSSGIPPYGYPTGTGGTYFPDGTTGSRTPTGSRPTGSNWTDVGRWVAEAAPLGPGSIVKDRFVLEEELGRGGMGVVYRARDLRKEEAQDRNPWVALKLLNEEFRRHPESLKALQRESRKAQQLAHANVVAVYDFDRDGGNVFMVMELLEGQSLDRLIRDHEASGVGVERALRITRDLCRAMAYAHEQGVVHSDFKPANAFLTRDGVVKVFDFGIARAAKRADNVSGSTTLFDPGTLGALTPTYASCEMIEGLEPDPRDDVYAIACVCYELLTGKHPFNRLSAVEARNKGMVAKRPKGLKRHQWRAILHGLEFNREKRTASAQQFLNELMPRKTRPTVHVGVAAALVVILVLAAVFIPSYLEKRREEKLIEALTTADSSRLDALVQQLRGLSPEARAAILLNESARTGLIAAFEGRINSATDPDQPVPDFPGARELLKELQGFLPDSLAVRDLEGRLVARENDEIKRLSDRFDDYLSRGLLIPAQGEENVDAVLVALRRIDKDNRLLRDPRLSGAFAQQTRTALDAGNVTLAQALITAGLSFDPQDATLADLRDQVQRAADVQRLAARVSELEAALAGLTAATATIADVDARRAEITELHSIGPNSKVLASIQGLIQRAVSEQSAALESQGQHAQAMELVARYADLLPSAFVDQQRQRLASARGVFEQNQAAIAQIRTQIDTLLQNQTAEARWTAQFEQELRRLAAYVSSSDAYVAEVRARAAAGYLELARSLRAAQRLTEAGRMLEQARSYAPRMAELVAEAKLLAEARSAQEAAAQERNRLAQIEALKEKLLIQARADDVNEALASLEQLRAALDPNDGFIVVQAPEAIGTAYLRLASNAAKDGRFANAVSLTARAAEIAPDMRDLASATERYGRYQAIDQSLKTSDTLEAAPLRSELERLARQEPTEAAAVKDRLARVLVARIRATTDANVARRLTSVAQEVFGDQAAVKNLSQPASATERPTAQETAQTEEATPTAATTADAAQPSAEAGGASAGTSAAANAAGSAGSASAQRRTRVAVAEPSASADQAGTARVPPDIPCTARLAGYGRRKQAVCYDTFIGGGQGPDLVVVPAGGAISKPFAFGRTEISNADYATYCTRTNRCTPPSGPPENPVTGISLEEARAYIAWLSEVTGAKYRLPTDAEWTHSVVATGASTDRSSVNCAVEIGGRKVRGLALEPVQSGAANAWGIYNALGNAQEWAEAGNAIVVRGGAFTDNVSACSPEASKAHSGAADAVTGLRVVRELE